MSTLISGINMAGQNTLAISQPGSVSDDSTQRKEAKVELNKSPTINNTESLKKLLEYLENHLQLMNINLSFSTYGEHNEKISVIVRDKETGKIIREIPPRELQNLYSKLEELIGIIFNDSA